MKQKASFYAIIKNIGIESVIASTLVFLLTVSATCLMGYQLYHYTKESLLLQGEVNAVRSAKEYDSYLVVRENTVMLSGNVVSEMVEKNKSHDEIMEYLYAQSASVKRSIDEESTGLYGWVNGEYCDGEGWVPGDDYIPTERPWYTETIADDRDITFVRPYLDEQTKTIMTTMAMELDDGESVLAYDVSLGKIQEITEQIASQSTGSYGIVLDSTGQVIAHSDSDELGKNYLHEEEGTMGLKLAEAVLRGDKQQFEFSYNERIYMAYVEDIEGGWKVISLLNTEVVYRPLLIILSLLIFFTILEAIIFIAIFINLSKKNMAISTQNMQIAAVADMYLTIYDIDIPLNRMSEIRRGKDVEKFRFMKDHQQDARSSLNEFFDRHVHENSKPLMDSFLDPDTLDERLENAETITEEFLDENKHWCRGRFIVADRDRNGHVVRVLGLIESIDEEKKRRDNLKRLSETDRMTGLLNRATGEGRIEELLQLGEGGMLLMIDADKFKSINDGFGHDVGDKVIIGIADSVARAVRSSDIVMRLGGDEFVAYAHGVHTEEVAEKLIKRIFDNIVGTQITELGDHRVYVSIGAAFCLPGTVMSFAELYKQADTCVYVSKKTEGNIVTFYKEEKGEENEEGFAE